MLSFFSFLGGSYTSASCRWCHQLHWSSYHLQLRLLFFCSYPGTSLHYFFFTIIIFFRFLLLLYFFCSSLFASHRSFSFRAACCLRSFPAFFFRIFAALSFFLSTLCLVQWLKQSIPDVIAITQLYRNILIMSPLLFHKRQHQSTRMGYEGQKRISCNQC